MSNVSHEGVSGVKQELLPGRLSQDELAVTGEGQRQGGVPPLRPLRVIDQDFPRSVCSQSKNISQAFQSWPILLNRLYYITLPCFTLESVFTDWFIQLIVIELLF